MALPANSFVERVGINIHTPLLSTQHAVYGTGAGIVTALQQTGIKHVRDGLVRANPAPHFHWDKLQYVADQTGGSICLIASCLSWFQTCGGKYWNFEQVLGWIKTYMPSTTIIEGENEADNAPVGGTGLMNATDRQKRIWLATRADSWFDDKIVLAPSFITAANYAEDQGGYSDAANGHPYPGGNFDTAARLAGQVALFGQQCTGKPVYFTEYGWPHTAPNSCTGQRGVTTAESARWLPTSLLLAIKAGVPRTYLYELADSNSCNWGLVTADGTPRLAATVLKNWITLLAETSSPTVADTPLTITDPAGVGKLDTLQFAKTDGSFWVAIYPTVEGAGNRTLTLSRPAGTTWSWQRHEPWNNTTPLGYVTQTNNFSVPLSGDNPVLIRLRPWT